MKRGPVDSSTLPQTEKVKIDIPNFIMLFIVQLDLNCLNCYLIQFDWYCRQYQCANQEREQRAARLRWQWREERQRKGVQINFFV